MQLTLRRPHFPTTVVPRPHLDPAPVYGSARDRERRSGGPEDQALYACDCGYAFKARVTTTVGCPQCGQTQAW